MQVLLSGLEVAGGAAVGFLLGHVAYWFGLGSAETFFAYNFSYLLCMCGVGLVGWVLFVITALVAPHPMAMVVVMGLTGLAFLWGLLKGIQHATGDRLGADLQE